MAVAVDWLDVAAPGPTLLRFGPVVMELVTGESTVSGKVWANVEVLVVGDSPGAMPFTTTGTGSSFSTAVTSGSGSGAMGGFGSSREG